MSVFLNLVVIRSSNIEKSVAFYQNLGLIFNKERHGNGPVHYACELNHLIFEIYPSQKAEIDTETRIGFSVSNIDRIIDKIRSIDGSIVNVTTISPWGKRAVIEDPDGHKIELVESL